MIHGNIEGIRDSILQELERMYDTQFFRDEFLPDRLLNMLVRFTEALNREMLVYLSREGEVLEISIGSISSIALPEMHLRRNLDRLSGFRCIHTHPGGSSRLSDVDLQALRLLRFDAMCAVGVQDGRATGISAAFLGEMEYDKLSINVVGPVKPGRIPQQLWMREIDLAEQRVQKAIAQGGLVEEAEKVMLISIDSDSSLDELAGLAETAGAVVISRVLQNRAKPDPGMFIGTGKAEELALQCQAQEIDLAIVDEEITGAQQKNLEKALGVRVIDRTALILDIFAQRAQTAEGKLQVELAQLKYRLPRLTGLGTSLSRLGGGIGTRGPGETKLETDRRHIRERIYRLQEELEQVRQVRGVQRERRMKNSIPVVAIVGYTNAGKSTLLNQLTGAGIPANNRLFDTLDTTSRVLTISDHLDVILSDTVGFISKLPHHLVEAFQATLEELEYADLLLHVIDAADEQRDEHVEVVEKLIAKLAKPGTPVLNLYNKADLVSPEDIPVGENVVAVSARLGLGMDRLLAAIEREVGRALRHVLVRLPYSMGGMVETLHSNAQVLNVDYTAEGIEIDTIVDDILLGRLRDYVIKEL